MQSAFLHSFGGFPPPPASPFIFTRLNRPRARVASNTCVARGVERMLRKSALVGVADYILRSPVGKRADFYRGSRAVENLDAGARFRLRPPQAGEISRNSPQPSRER